MRILATILDSNLGFVLLSCHLARPKASEEELRFFFLFAAQLAHLFCQGKAKVLNTPQVQFFHFVGFDLWI